MTSDETPKKPSNHERPCANAHQTVELVVCENNGLKATERQLQKVYDSLKSTLTGSARETLVKQERAWLKKREIDCEGKEASSELLNCISRLTKERIASLNKEINPPNFKLPERITPSTPSPWTTSTRQDSASIRLACQTTSYVYLNSRVGGSETQSSGSVSNEYLLSVNPPKNTIYFQVNGTQRIYDNVTITESSINGEVIDYDNQLKTKSEIFVNRFTGKFVYTRTGTYNSGDLSIIFTEEGSCQNLALQKQKF